MDSEFRGHTGELKHDSPGLLGLVRQFLREDEVKQLAEVYCEACRCGALNESSVVRQPGISYNPRPARICQILINECSEKGLRVLGAAMYACAARNGESGSAFVEEWQIASRVRMEISNYRDGHRFELTEVEEAIFLAVKLDELRHMHMTPLPEEHKRDVYRQVKEKLVPSIVHSSSSRLKALIESWLNRFERGMSRP